jgi:hypothetical protein
MYVGANLEFFDKIIKFCPNAVHVEGHYFYAFVMLFHADKFPNKLITLYFITPAIVEVEVNLRPTVNWPVSLGAGHPSGTCDQFSFLPEISF